MTLKPFHYFLIFSSFILLNSCGKPAGENSIVKDVLNKTVQEKETLLTPLAGRYEGTLINQITQEEQSIVMVLIPTILIVQNPGQNDVTEMPTLGGNINIIMNSNDPSDVIPLAQFTTAKFDSESGHLRLNGTINTGTSIGSVLNTFDGMTSKNRITGTLFNSTRGTLGTINVQKTF